MPSQLPESGPEREIFITALRLFSAQCEAPDLTAECPFSIDLPNGHRGCGAECEDLIEAHGGGQSPGEVEISSTYSIKPRQVELSRAVRLDDAYRPYDAGQLARVDALTTEMRQWRTGSLIYYVLKELGSSPGGAAVPHVNTITVDDCLRELFRRDFDVDKLLRFGIKPLVVDSIVGLVAEQTARDFDQFEPDDDERIPGDQIGPWYELSNSLYTAPKQGLDIRIGFEFNINGASTRVTGDGEVSARLMFIFLGPFRELVENWAEVSSIATLQARTAPSLEDLRTEPRSQERTTETDLPDHDAKIARWIVDRYTRTYLTDWSNDSLRMEWRYRRDPERAPLSDSELQARDVDMADLASRVADLEMSTPVRRSRGWPIREAAIELLQEGRHRAAASLFAALIESEDDAEYYNNYGFCILPDAPEASLGALDFALKHGFNQSVNLANRILAMFWLGRTASAIDLAERAVSSEWQTLDGGQHILWGYTAGQSGAGLISTACVRCYVRDLGHYIAHQTERPDEIAKWDRLKRVSVCPEHG